MSEFIQTSPRVVSSEQVFIQRVYGWMALGLAISAVIAFFLLGNPPLLMAYLRSPLAFILPFVELGMVWWMFSRIGSFSTGKATGLFLVYAAMNGVTLTPILLQYTKASIVSTFFVTGATFGVTSFYGYVTKKNLSSIGGLVFMGFIGLIIASLINIFFQSPAIYWICTYAGVGLSIAVTAYYTQQIKAMSHGMFGDERMESNAAILRALMLYVAFVMMFVYLLRILGNRR